MHQLILVFLNSLIIRIYTLVNPFEIPKGITVHYLPHSVVWMDRGILRNAKRDKEKSNDILTFNQVKAELFSLRRIIGEKKVCVLAQDRTPLALDAQQKQLVTTEFNDITVAMAILTTSAFKARILNGLFTVMKRQGYPVRYFQEPDRAIQWLSNQSEKKSN